MSEALTHKDLAKLCGVSETTIKSYRRKFPNFIPVLTEGKPIRFRPEAGEICLTIRDCFAKGMSVNATWKVLKENFKEYRKDKSGKGAKQTSTAQPADPTSGVSPEYMEKFFETAGQMMHGMAQLATAQARSDQRLKKLEKAIEGLVATETRNQERFAEMLETLRGTTPSPGTHTFSPDMDRPGSEAESPDPTPEPSEEAASAPVEEEKAHRPRRRILNVRGREGVKSYELGEEREEAEKAEAERQDETSAKAGATGMEHPSDTFMDTPIVIRNEQGEFLGVPGRLPLRGFVHALENEAGNAGRSSWERRDRSWVYEMQAANGERHELFFGGTKTPRGNLVVLLWRLDVDGKETSPAFLQEFFRQIKDRIAG